MTKIDEACVDSFARQGYAILPALVEPAVLDFLWSYVHTKSESQLLSIGDRQVPNASTSYGDLAFDALLEYLRPSIEACTGRQLFPTYSYFRIYGYGDVLKPHRDREACEISLSLNIGQVPSAPWPIYVDGHSKTFKALLSPGDALIYRGLDLTHWREPFSGQKMIQGFLHYVDRDGPHAGQKFDGRKTLMRQKSDSSAQPS